MTSTVKSRLPMTVVIWTALTMATFALALLVVGPATVDVAADSGPMPTLEDRSALGDITGTATGSASDCAQSAPNGTCFPYQADRATWSSGMHPFSKRMH